MVMMMAVVVASRRGHNTPHTRRLSVSPSIEFHNRCPAETQVPLL